MFNIIISKVAAIWRDGRSRDQTRWGCGVPVSLTPLLHATSSCVIYLWCGSETTWHVRHSGAPCGELNSAPGGALLPHTSMHSPGFARLDTRILPRLRHCDDRYAVPVQRSNEYAAPIM